MGELFVIVWAICLLAVPIMAVQKNRSGFLWFILAVLFGPVALLIVAVASAERPDGTKPEGGFIRKCPFCAEGIRKDAVVCLHCGKDLTATTTAPDSF